MDIICDFYIEKGLKKLVNLYVEEFKNHIMKDHKIRIIQLVLVYDGSIDSKHYNDADYLLENPTYPGEVDCVLSDDTDFYSLTIYYEDEQGYVGNWKWDNLVYSHNDYVLSKCN